MIQNYGIGVHKLFDQKAKVARDLVGRQLTDEEAFTVLGLAVDKYNREPLGALLETEKVGFLT